MDGFSSSGTVENTKPTLHDVRERIHFLKGAEVRDHTEILAGLVMDLDNIHKAINELLEKTFTVESPGSPFGRIASRVIEVIKDSESKAAHCFRDKAVEIEVV